MGVVGSWRIVLDPPAPERRPRPRAVRYLIFTLLVALLALGYWWMGIYLEPLSRWDVSFSTQVEAALSGIFGLSYLGIPLVMVALRRPGSYWWCWGAIFLLSVLGSVVAIAGAALALFFVATLPAIRAYYGLEPQHAFTVRIRRLLFY